MKLPKKSKILSISPEKNSTYKITTSLGIEFRVPEELLLKMSLFEGGEITDSDIDELKASKDYFKVRNMALTLLEYRMRSKKELESKLCNKGINKNTIFKVIEELEDKGWVDDEKFCLAFSRDQINRNSIGPIALKYKLNKHIDSFDLIEEVLSKVYFELSVENIIMNVLVKHSPEEIKSNETLRRKIINRLKRKGHYWQDIDETLSKYLNS